MLLLDGTWLPTREQAISIQRTLAPSVQICPLPQRPRNIAGADVAYLRHEAYCFAATVVLDAVTGEELDQAVVRHPVSYPYVSGLLAFREVPPLLHAFSKLREVPDLVFADGHGILHPRGLGLASHLGILLGVPTIGCAKGPPLRKSGFGDLPRGKRGTYHSLALTGDRPAGVLLHTRDLSRPLCISPGHRITLKESIQWTLETTGRYRIPEPLRRAHQLATGTRRASQVERAKAKEPPLPRESETVVKPKQPS